MNTLNLAIGFGLLAAAPQIIKGRVEFNLRFFAFMMMMILGTLMAWEGFQ